MGRGTHRLYTSWTPLGDIPRELGGLMILEDSIHRTDRLRKYLERDVDQYCVNRPDAADIASGKKLWQWGGALAANPVTLRENLGGRWLTTDYRAGDVLMFSVYTVHASLDNQTNRFRLSSDSRYQLATDPVDERWISLNGQPPIAHSVAGKRGRIC
jgi:ectoine hydroxylase-related dioxygenase (phytanoyl-CoA dioxygenase family)